MAEEFSVNPTLDHYRGKLAASKASFNDVWETVRTEVEQAILQNDAQKTLLENALDIVTRMPTVANGGNPFGGPVSGANGVGQVDESAFKNMWNFNLADAAFGYLVLEVEGGRIGTEMRAQGFNFAHRGGGTAAAPTGKPPSTQPVPLQNVPPQGASGAPPSAPTGPAQARGPAFAAPSQPFPQPPAQAPRPPQIPAPAQATPNPAPAPAAPVTPAAAPAAPVAPANQTKPMTPQPSTTNVNLPGGANTGKPAVNTTNGTPAQEKPADSPKPTPSPVVEKKPATALYIMNAKSETDVRKLFPDEDSSKIKSVTAFGKTGTSFVVNFDNHDDCKAAFDRQPLDKKNRSKDPDMPNIRYFEERPSNRNFHHRESQGGAGTWQGSSRGGASANTRGGYQSGGASDSEGGRGGRGGYRGRGGRGRGSDDRGGRGGRGGGRGGFHNKNTDGASDSKGTADKPAAASGGEP